METIAELPPDLPGKPFLGSALAMQADTLGFLREAERHGPLVPFRIVRQRWVLASRAETIEEVLLDRARAFEKPDSIYGAGRMIFGNALTGMKGEAWRQRRSLVAPAFHRQPVEAAAIVAATDRWAERHAPGSRFRIDRELEELMVEVAFTSMLGSDSRDTGRLAEPIGAALAAMAKRVQLGVPIPDWAPLPVVRQMRSSVGEVNAFIDAVLARRQAEGELGDDLLGQLAGNGDAALDPASARDEVAVAAAVGGHQMSIALAWTFYLLARHPEQAERLRAEVDSALGGERPTLDSLTDLRFGAMALEESMRLYPPFYLIGREALRDTVVAGTRIPAKTTIVLSPWVTQRLERYFEAPDEFRPERWDGDLARRLPRGAYFPTGGGGRLCVAQSSLRKQMLLVLASLLQRHRVEIDPKQAVEPRTTTSLEISRGLFGSLHRRG